MAWSFVAQGALASGNNVASLSVAIPTVIAGDLLVMQFQCFGGTNSRTPSTPTGWRPCDGSTGTWTNGTAKHGFWYRVARPGDSGTNVTLSLSGTGVTGDTQLARIAAFRCAPNCIPTSPESATNQTNTSNDSVGPITGINTDAGDLVVMTGGKANDWNGASVAQSGWTKATDSESTTGNDAGMFLHYVLNDSAQTPRPNETVTDNGATASAGVGLGSMARFYEVVQTFPPRKLTEGRLKRQASSLRAR